MNMIFALTGFLGSITALIGTIAAVYFKLRDKVEQVHDLTNQARTDLVERLDSMTAERDHYRDK